MPILKKLHCGTGGLEARLAFINLAFINAEQKSALRITRRYVIALTNTIHHKG